MRPASVVLVSLATALLGALAAIGIGSAAGWIGDTDTVIVGGQNASCRRPGLDPLRGAATPLVGGNVRPGGRSTRRARRASSRSSPSSATSRTTRPALAGLRVRRLRRRARADELARRHDRRRRTPARRTSAPHRLRPVRRRRPCARADRRLRPLHRRRRAARRSERRTASRPCRSATRARVVVGEPVAAIGSPFGNESSLAVGVVSATKRSIASLTSIYNVVDAIQIDAPINRGNSGGPLFDARGRVIGINAQIRTDSGQSEGVGFAIPINSAKRSMEQLIAERAPSPTPTSACTTQDLTPALARRSGSGAREAR